MHFRPQTRTFRMLDFPISCSRLFSPVESKQPGQHYCDERANKTYGKAYTSLDRMVHVRVGGKKLHNTMMPSQICAHSLDALSKLGPQLLQASM